MPRTRLRPATRHKTKHVRPPRLHIFKHGLTLTLTLRPRQWTPRAAQPQARPTTKTEPNPTSNRQPSSGLRSPDSSPSASHSLHTSLALTLPTHYPQDASHPPAVHLPTHAYTYAYTRIHTRAPQWQSVHRYTARSLLQHHR